MLEYHGSDRRSMITGSSVHNQRIERLWRDMHQCAIKLYYRLFYYLEEQGILDPNDDTDIYALHYVYIRVNNRVRTDHGQSPKQLFVTCALQLCESGLIAFDCFENIDDSYGIDEKVLTVEESGVSVPEGRFSLTSDNLYKLQQEFDPLEENENHGIELYERTLAFIQYVVLQNPLAYGI